MTGDLFRRLANKDKVSICFRRVFNRRLHEGALNDAINYAQKGCAVQIGGMTPRASALIVSAYPYCACKFTYHAIAMRRARALSTKLNNNSFAWI